jgi:NAD-dependent deacetylase
MKRVKIVKYKSYICLHKHLCMKKLVVLTGSGVSSESGLKTFRDSGGLWENYDVMEVASYEGWTKNMELVLQYPA